MRVRSIEGEGYRSLEEGERVSCEPIRNEGDGTLKCFGDCAENMQPVTCP